MTIMRLKLVGEEGFASAVSSLLMQDRDERALSISLYCDALRQTSTWISDGRIFLTDSCCEISADNARLEVWIGHKDSQKHGGLVQTVNRHDYASRNDS
jgi:hypothetical protein